MNRRSFIRLLGGVACAKVVQPLLPEPNPYEMFDQAMDFRGLSYDRIPTNIVYDHNPWLKITWGPTTFSGLELLKDKDAAI